MNSTPQGQPALVKNHDSHHRTSITFSTQNPNPISIPIYRALADTFEVSATETQFHLNDLLPLDELDHLLRASHNKAQFSFRFVYGPIDLIFSNCHPNQATIHILTPPGFCPNEWTKYDFPPQTGWSGHLNDTFRHPNF